MSTTTMPRIIREDGIASDWCGRHIRFPESESESESESEFPDGDELDATAYNQFNLSDQDYENAVNETFDASYSYQCGYQEGIERGRQEGESDSETESDIDKFRFVIETLNMSNIPKSHRDTIEDILFGFLARGNRYRNEYTELSQRALARRRYVAPTVNDPLVPVMENGEKKWYRRSECCGSYSWGGEELWVRS